MRHRYRDFWAIALICNFLLLHLALASPVFVPQFLSGGTGRNIRHLPCVSRRTGETGVCMFAFTCAKANGTHLGTCIDRFYFGSCCKIDDEPDVFPQDNTIDIDNPSSLPKPFTTTTSQAFESNDIPGNVDKLKPSVKPVTEQVTLITRATEATTFKAVETTKFKTTKITTKKPIVEEPTTESIRLSTFQTVQNASEQRPVTLPSTSTTFTTKRPQRPSISDVKPVSQKPKPASTFAYTTPTSNTATTSAYLSSSSELTTILVSKPSRPPSSTYGHYNISSSKRPSSTTVLTKKPTTTIGITTKPILINTAKPNFNTTAHRNVTTSTLTTNKITESSRPSTIQTTTQRIHPITRFPPRNATTVTHSSTFATESSSHQTSTVASTTKKHTEGVQKTTTTRKPSTTKKPTKVTTKRPSTITKRPLTTVTKRPTTLNTTSTSSTGTKITPTITTTAATTATNVYTTTITSTTKKPSTVGLTKKPSSTTTRLTTTTKKPVITTLKKNVTSSYSTRPTTASSLKITSTTRKPVTSHKPLSTATTSQLNVISTSVKPLLSSIPSSTTTLIQKTTEKPKVPQSITTKFTTPSTTTTKTSTASRPITQTSVKPVTRPHMPTTTISSLTNQKNATSTYNASTVTSVTVETENEVNNEIDQTTIAPGIVTWTSFTGDDTESSTKTAEYSSVAPETTETDWTPITTPDGWIIIQSPTTEKTEPETSVEAKPTTLHTTQTPSISVKPVTESTTTKQTTTTTTQRVTTQSTSYMDMLSTLASVTVSPEFTEPPLAPLNMSNFKEVCGRRLFPESRIVGGDGSTFGKWPWQISLRQWRTSTYLHKCGAALLNENWAITAAHCVQNVLPSDLLLRIGEHDLGNEEEPYGFQERRVQIVASHPNFDPRTFEFDLALMRFYEPVLPFQPNVLPICVPDDDEDYVGQTAFVTGWGRLYEDGPLPSVLQEVAVPVINNSVCEGMYRNAGYIEHIPHIFICAGWRKGGFDSCEGDSGGPLVIQRKRDKRWVLAGVISWGIGCAEPNQPGVYTRISEFREWINQILQF